MAQSDQVFFHRGVFVLTPYNSNEELSKIATLLQKHLHIYELVDLTEHMRTAFCRSLEDYVKQLKEQAGIIVVPIGDRCIRFTVRMDSDVADAVSQITDWHEQIRMANIGLRLLGDLFAGRLRPVVNMKNQDTT